MARSLLQFMGASQATVSSHRIGHAVGDPRAICLAQSEPIVAERFKMLQDWGFRETWFSAQIALCIREEEKFAPLT